MYASQCKEWCDLVSRLCCPLCHQTYLDWAKTYIWTLLMASSVALAAALLYSQATIIFTTNYYIYGSAITVSLVWFNLWDPFILTNQGLYLNSCTSISLVLPNIGYWRTKPMMIYILTIVVDAIIHGWFSLYKHVCVWDTLMANPIAGLQKCYFLCLAGATNMNVMSQR